MLTRGAGERGFTLVEMIVALSIGMVVLLAVVTLVDQSLFASQRVSDRVDAQARGRTALAEIERQLHSAVCVTNPGGGSGLVPPVVGPLDPQQVTLYTDLPDAATVVSDGSMTRKRQLQFTADGRLAETTWDTPPGFAHLVGTRTLLTGVTAPVFTYQGYDGSGNLVPTSDPTKVAEIEVAFNVQAHGGAPGTSKQDAAFQDAVALGLPTDFTSSPVQGPVCTP